MSKHAAGRIHGNRRAAPRAGRRGAGLVWLLPALGVVIAAVTGWSLVRQSGTPSVARQTAVTGPVPAEVAGDLASVPQKTFDRAGTDTAPQPLLVGVPPTRKAKPVVLYIGAEYCPYCAALRWPMILALDRFGTLHGLKLSTSSATDVFPGTPTFTMMGATYRSPYVELQTVELQGNVPTADGRYPPLERPAPGQAALFRRYDPPGNIPFLLIDRQYLLAGSPFSPGLLTGKNWQAIAASLRRGTTPAARAILGTANQIAAAVCAVDGRAPAAVCQSPGVRGALDALPRAGN